MGACKCIARPLLLPQYSLYMSSNVPFKFPVECVLTDQPSDRKLQLIMASNLGRLISISRLMVWKLKRSMVLSTHQSLMSCFWNDGASKRCLRIRSQGGPSRRGGIGLWEEQVGRDDFADWSEPCGETSLKYNHSLQQSGHLMVTTSHSCSRGAHLHTACARDISGTPDASGYVSRLVVCLAPTNVVGIASETCSPEKISYATLKHDFL
jgi:hypothetical protein